VTDPVASRTLLDIIWKLALVLGVALTAEWLMLRGLRRPLPALAKLVPAPRLQHASIVEAATTPHRGW
jgi:hypothetical protein